MTDIDPNFFILSMLLAFALTLGFAYLVLSWAFKERKGDYVAEVWLIEWDASRSTALYRQRFKTEWLAALHSKLAALSIELMLPKKYTRTNGNGNRETYVYMFELKFGVRAISLEERQHFQKIWSPYRPSSKRSRGERASTHPVRSDFHVFNR